jgi:hypothetical protein
MTDTFHIHGETAFIGEREIPWGTVTSYDAGNYHARGVHIRFESGWTLSIQWGSGNYGDNHSMTGEFIEEARYAEIALWDVDDKWFDFGGDTVKGWVTPAQVNEIIDYLAQPRLEPISLKELT